MSQNIPTRQVVFIIVIFAVVQFTIQMSLLTKGMEYAATSLVIDDTYYYMQTAWNTKLLGFATFDGLHPTNGVQMLWFVIILFLAMLAQSKAALLFATLAVNFLFNALCYLVIWRLGATLKQPALTLLMAGLWALQSLPYRIYSMGMENSLHALVLWCVIWQSVEFLIRIHKNERPNFGALTVVLIVNAWTRLDSALLSAILFAFCVGTLAFSYRRNISLFWRRHFRAIGGSGLLAVSGLIILLTAFWLMGDSILPVSALVKTSAAGRGLNIEPIDKLVRVITLGMPSILQGRFPAPVLILVGISGVLLVFLLRAVLRDHSDEIRAFLNLWSCLLVCEIIYHAYVGLSEVEYARYFLWYRSPTYIFWIATGSLLVIMGFAAIRLLMKRPITIPGWVPVGLSVFTFAIALYMFSRSIDFASPLYVARYNAALWIEEHSPPDAVFASWNAGQLGYFSNRTLINLDGVINSMDYYERVILGSTSLAEYLSENNVEFVVDYETYGLIPDLPVVQAFPVNDGSGRTIYIWRVSPQVSSSS